MKGKKSFGSKHGKDPCWLDKAKKRNINRKIQASRDFLSISNNNRSYRSIISNFLFTSLLNFSRKIKVLIGMKDRRRIPQTINKFIRSL